MTAAFTGDIYRVGDHEARPWGNYVVTGIGTNDAGEEFCTKDITVAPGAALSLQSHDLRRETWTVKSGELTVILDDQRILLTEGQSVDIPLQAIHCMANLSTTFCVVAELQVGTCREADIKRYVDTNGRQTEPLTTPKAQASVALYNQVAAEIQLMKTNPTFSDRLTPA